MTIEDPCEHVGVGKGFADQARIIGIGGHISAFPQPSEGSRLAGAVLGRWSSFPCLITAASQEARYRHILVQCFPVQPAPTQFDRFSLDRSGV